MQTTRVVVIGNGMVGQRLVDDLLDLDDGACEVTVFGEEPRLAYDRVKLSAYFDGATPEDLSLVGTRALDAATVTYRAGVEVTAIDREAKVVLTSDGATAYDHLVLATGSYPFVPPIPGRDASGCHVYRTIEDLEAIASSAMRPGATTGVVIGGGLLGLEAANALKTLGLDTHVVEMAPHLMPQQLGPAPAAMLAHHLRERDITLHLEAATAAIEADSEGALRSLRFADGEELACDVLVFSAGIRPRDNLARECGLAVGERGGVVVDDLLATEDPSVSAVGEVACHRGRTYGLVAPGYQMARILAERLAGSASTPFETPDLSTKLKLVGVDVASFGQSVPRADDHLLTYSDPIGLVHRELVVDDDGAVRGGALVGDASGYETLRMMAAGDVPTPEGVQSLVLPDGLAPNTDSVELPDQAQVCTCNGVSAGDIRQAVANGAHTLAAVAECTAAGTSCAGCVPAVTALVNTTLAEAGHDVGTSICAHFPHTRQELFDLIRFHQHRSWREVIETHGHGLGCHVCRPAVASILASLSSGHILDGDQGSLQDTNDHALANMQRNGTYSVVPRVPGGEITPEQLIALGEIASDYSLYTKITGAQRIDLFGAQLHELPDIWARVVEAGMESGHAYGKALRTVKSCMGSVWCRYGVQDAVSMAIRIEHGAHAEVA